MDSLIRDFVMWGVPVADLQTTLACKVCAVWSLIVCKSFTLFALQSSRVLVYATSATRAAQGE